MKSDIEIAQAAKMKPIEAIAKEAGFKPEEVELHGKYKAKIKLSVEKRLKGKKQGKLILVTTMTPTKCGEGKTTITIGLGQALRKIKKKSFICIREPSLGPVMGLKGGAAGGGYSQVLPMDEINLHFIGDMHYITAAHNLLAALVDNHIYQGNELGIDPGSIVWNRCMDMNDRALRKITIDNGEYQRVSSFDITAASEVMAVVCLSMTLDEMKKRLGEIIVGYTYSGEPVTADDLKAQGAMTLLLKEALQPNLVQTIEGGPAFVHGGPFANIAHGCNTLIATKVALGMADYVVTEAGFGADLGAEKFFDIKCRQGELTPNAVVIVVTTKALKHQGEKEQSLAKGFDNLKKHCESITLFGIPFVVAINKTTSDTKEEIAAIEKWCHEHKIPVEVVDVWERGGIGGVGLAKKVVELCNKPSHFKPLYQLDLLIKEKIKTIAQKIYGAKDVVFAQEAEDKIAEIEEIGYGHLPICMAKTNFSLTDDPNLLGRPKDFTITVRDLKVQAGAGFIVAYTGKIMTMPGLPKHPAAENMDITEDGKIVGLF
ncbi:MAG: formate--tetrahydrofolate ligase [Candidatus Saganbacteria bacterium]|nr:formate--tetrahydrofolate ligase [Candidatus Saganbacteria bacterium]